MKLIGFLTLTMTLAPADSDYSRSCDQAASAGGDDQPDRQRHLARLD